MFSGNTWPIHGPIRLINKELYCYYNTTSQVIIMRYSKKCHCYTVKNKQNVLLICEYFFKFTIAPII